MDKGDIILKIVEEALPRVADWLTPKIKARDVTAEVFTNAFLSNGLACGYFTSTPVLPEQIVASCSTAFSSSKAEIFTDRTADNWTLFKTEKDVATWGGGFDAQAQDYLVMIAPRENGLSKVVICFRLPKGQWDLFRIFDKKSYERIARIADLIRPHSGLIKLAKK